MRTNVADVWVFRVVSLAVSVLGIVGLLFAYSGEAPSMRRPA
jgi:hypothetical protein